MEDIHNSTREPDERMMLDNEKEVLAVPCNTNGEEMKSKSSSTALQQVVVPVPVPVPVPVVAPVDTSTKSRKQLQDEEAEEQRQKTLDRWIAQGTLIVGACLLLGGILTLVVALVKKGDTTTETETETESDELEDGDDDSEEGNSGLLVGILALVGGFVMTSWGWLLKNSADMRSDDNEDDIDEDDNEHDAVERGEEVVTRQSKNRPSIKPPPRPLMRNRLNDERAKGEPPFDKLIVGGTLSLGLIMFIGGLTILSISLVDQSAYKDVSLKDFQSLGRQGCRIDSTVSYSVVTEKLDALNSLCNEVYQYQVELTVEDSATESTTPTTFVSTTLVRTMCKASCDICPPDRLNGQNFYVGVDLTRPGAVITNSTYVECWAPTKPVPQLSDYYQCGIEGGSEVNPSQATKCYQLEDTKAELEDLQGSNQAGIIAGSIGFAGAIVMTFGGLYFAYRNRKASKEHALLVLEQTEPVEAVAPENQLQEVPEANGGLVDEDVDVDEDDEV